jgi:hypothetical protein
MGLGPVDAPSKVVRPVMASGPGSQPSVVGAPCVQWARVLGRGTGTSRISRRVPSSGTPAARMFLVVNGSPMSRKEWHQPVPGSARPCCGPARALDVLSRRGLRLCSRRQSARSVARPEKW